MGAAGSLEGDEPAELGVGDRVVVVGLEKRPDLNGRAGTLKEFDEIAGRWAVVFEDGGGVKVKPDNLERDGAGNADAEEAEQQEDDDEDEPAFPWQEDQHRGLLPEGGEFTADDLLPWNGVERPMCLGICGLVVDVSSSQNFRPNHGYGKLWAGRDCTLAMAKTSLEAKDTGRFDWKLEDLDEGSFKALVGWYKHYTSKYPVVGKLKEYDDWDFSGVVAAASEAKLPAFSGSG